jgi:hypothetical protein
MISVADPTSLGVRKIGPTNASTNRLNFVCAKRMACSWCNSINPLIGHYANAFDIDRCGIVIETDASSEITPRELAEYGTYFETLDSPTVK